MTPDQITTLLGAVPMPLVLIGRDERIGALNPAAAALFGEGAVGRHYITVLRQPALLDCVERALATGAPAEDELLSAEAFADTTYRARAVPMDGAGTTGILLSLEDISDMQAAGQMRRDFVANVSHELRSPLTALIGFIETLRGPARDDPQAGARFLAIMQREADRMNRLIGDLLSLSRVEADERLRPKTRVDVAATVSAAVAMLDKLAADAGVALSLSGAEAPLQVPGDADQLLQVFTNLIENAIKYGQTKVAIDISVNAHDRVLRAPALRIEVADDGPGIDALHIPRLTERFYRVDDHRSREMGGTGLGLAIVKHIVNRHRGRLRIKSVPGQGSRFIVVLPQGAPDA